MRSVEDARREADERMRPIREMMFESLERKAERWARERRRAEIEERRRSRKGDAMTSYDRMRADYVRMREAEHERLRAEGRREMLWLMAVGATCSRALTDDYERAGVAYEVCWFALCALSNMGDERAREMLR